MASSEIHPVSSTRTTPLENLPRDLYHEILQYLRPEEIVRLGRVSRCTHRFCIPWLWRDVELVDGRTARGDNINEHDDEPMVKKLIVLASNSHLASHVRTLNLRCHLPTPSVPGMVNRATSALQTPSSTIHLVVLAARNMVNVHTLRIVSGHASLNDALLRCFFDKHRKAESQVRRLWLEDCHISTGYDLHLQSHPYDLPRDLDFGRLESVRLRRLPIQPESSDVPNRGDGYGGQYRTTITRGYELLDQAEIRDHIPFFNLVELTSTAIARQRAAEEVTLVSAVERLFCSANARDDFIPDRVSRDCTASERALLATANVVSHRERTTFEHCGWLRDPLDLGTASSFRWVKAAESLQNSSADVLHNLLASCTATLTSLNLDWALIQPKQTCAGVQDSYLQWFDLFRRLFKLRFPHLRALQFRQAAQQQVSMPHRFYLLDRHRLPGSTGCSDASGGPGRVSLVSLEFMEAHPRIRCLAWPMGEFFSETPLRDETTRRFDAVIENLAEKLVDLRVDATYAQTGEPLSEDISCPAPHVRTRRRRFISEFAARMKCVRSIKLEGGIPRDERREVVRALHQSPLETIVMRGVCFPVGNTWGVDASDLSEHPSLDVVRTLAVEHEHTISAWASQPLTSAPITSSYHASYGWPPGPPLIYTIAAYHASTITKLKFCGDRGSPPLYGKTAITDPLLSSLRHFPRLRHLAMSYWLTTGFDGEPRDDEIVHYWQTSRHLSNTSPTSVLPNGDFQGLQGWEKELQARYTPRALATAVTRHVGPLLNEEAKTRSGIRGVLVRASFRMRQSRTIYDLDVWIGPGNTCLDFEGPRTERHKERRRKRMAGRKWI